MKRLLLTVCLVTACLAVPPKIVRPCHVKNKECLRENLAANSACKPRFDSVPSEYKIPIFKFYTPYFNATYIDHDLVIRNHNKCAVSEFFYNMASDTAVLSLDCPFLRLESTRTLIQHASKAENTQYSFKFHGTYPLIRLTINLPHANSIDLCSSFTFADVTALPIFDINPTDVKTAKFLSTDLTLMNIYERETFSYRANQLARKYINSEICDFGCDS
ncbi:fibrohexamerin-like [Danaus plexippus]|uniref:Fibrohexamerin n=1 Tax=Danaus plexippus plexippus TaxID=278856 RepID=A0A212EPK5_DANPL|nr:fibrohexamerin-like [Danaus plexippus]OWR43406.1 silk protein P25 [Danaus plexippus plexippus]